MYKVRKINFGWYRRRHGILLENLPPSKQKFLLENDYLKWLKPDPQTYEIIFRIIDMKDFEKTVNKPLWNPFKETFTTLKELELDSNIIDWTCGICSADIKSRMDSKKVENFVCEKCQKSHNSTNKFVDTRIIESSVKFNKHCKRLLKKEQNEFINYTRKSSKR
jgi:hypothetical protein